jgi:hypothetical protein
MINGPVERRDITVKDNTMGMAFFPEDRVVFSVEGVTIHVRFGDSAPRFAPSSNS